MPEYFRSTEALSAHGQAAVLLSMWHLAAASGDFEGYFGRMTDDAVFLGTDRAERWTREEFEAFSRPYFDGVEAWTYRQVETNLTIGPGEDPDTVWVDEVLWNDKYGYCRGTGLLTREPDGRWLIHRYSLSLLVPNEKSAEVMDAIGPQPAPGDPVDD